MTVGGARPIRATYRRMPKNSYPPPPSIPFQTNATTAGPSLVTAITSDPGYRAKTAEIVLTREHGILKMSVYRASTSRDALGMLSRDDHERTHDGLKYVGKAKIKYLRTAHADRERGGLYNA